MNLIWLKVFDEDVQRILDSFELQFGAAELPLSFRFLRRSFSNLTQTKIEAYKVAVQRCDNDIKNILQEEKEEPDRILEAALRRLHDLRDETLT